MLPVNENITIHAGIKPNWSSLLRESSASLEDDLPACQIISEFFTAHSYEPSEEDLQYLKSIIDERSNTERLSFLFMAISSSCSYTISSAILSQLIRLNAAHELITLALEQNERNSLETLIQLCSENPLKIDAITKLIKLQHISTKIGVSPLFIYILFGASADELEAKTIFIELLLSKNINPTLSLLEKIFQYPDTNAAIKIFKTYQLLFPLDPSSSDVLSEIFFIEPAYLAQNLSDFFSSILSERVLTTKPDSRLKKIELQHLFLQIDYQNVELASAKIKEVLFLLKSPFPITLEQISFLLFASDSSTARQILMEVRTIKKIRVTETHAQAIMNRNNSDTLLALLRFIIKHNTIVLNQESFTKLVLYPDWEALASAIKHLQRNNLLDILWLNFSIILSTRPNSLAETLHTMANQRKAMIHEFMRNIIMIPPPVRFITETELSKRHDYGHQKTFNNGTANTITNLKLLYLDQITGTENIESVKKSLENWMKSLPNEKKLVAETACSSIASFSQHKIAIPEADIYKISLDDFLLLSWLALNDHEQREDGINDNDAYDYFLDTIADIKPGLCPDGHYKKLAESLISIHRQAIQAGPTMQMLKDKFPIIVKNYAETYLKSLDTTEAARLYHKIAKESLRVIWDCIRPLVNQAILEEFEDVAPQGLNTVEVAILEQHIDSISLNISEFEGRASPKRPRP